MADMTPFDTGARLEPRVWPAVDPDGILDEDRYGRVDFDDDESATVLNVHVSCEDPRAQVRSFVLAVEGVADLRDASEDPDEEQEFAREELALTVDGAPVLVMGEIQQERLHLLIELARRGRDDFMHQAETTDDYTEDDKRLAEAQWASVSSLIDRIEFLID